MELKSRCAGLLQEERLPFPEHQTSGILELGNHGVDLNIINHSNKYRIRLFWDMFVTMQNCRALALSGRSAVWGFSVPCILNLSHCRLQSLPGAACSMNKNLGWEDGLVRAWTRLMRDTVVCICNARHHTIIPEMVRWKVHTGEASGPASNTVKRGEGKMSHIHTHIEKMERDRQRQRDRLSLAFTVTENPPALSRICISFQVYSRGNKWVR